MGSWRKEQGRDRFFRLAHEEGYRARSAYKLQEIAERFKLFRPGYSVLDLGAAPGSWSQLAARAIGAGDGPAETEGAKKGRVVAVDLTVIEPIPGVITIQGDMTDPDVQSKFAEALGGLADVVMSDAAPNTIGIALSDHMRSIELSDAALALSLSMGKKGSSFVVKVFRGGEFDAFVKRARVSFREVKVVLPEAVRKESKEAYVVGVGRR